jgi:hypothetical protein
MENEKIFFPSCIKQVLGTKYKDMHISTNVYMHKNMLIYEEIIDLKKIKKQFIIMCNKILIYFVMLIM